MAQRHLQVIALVNIALLALSCLVPTACGQSSDLDLCRRQCENLRKFYEMIYRNWASMIKECSDRCVVTVRPLPIIPAALQTTTTSTAILTTNQTPTTSESTTVPTTTTIFTTVPTTTRTTTVTTTIPTTIQTTTSTSTTVPTTTRTTSTSTTVPTTTRTTASSTTLPTTIKTTTTSSTTIPTTIKTSTASSTTIPTTTRTTTASSTTVPTTTRTTTASSTTIPTTTRTTTASSTTIPTTTRRTTAPSTSKDTSTTTSPPVTTLSSTEATSFDCGKQRSGIHQHRQRVVGGFTADECEYPWMTFVSVVNNACAGSILDKRHILTAAHCVKDRRTNEPVQNQVVHVRIGSSFITSTNKYSVVHIATHPSHDPINKVNDVAVLTVAEDIIFSDCASPICLPEPESDPRNATNCFVAGWGVTDTSAPNSTPYLQEVELPIVDQDLCLRRYGPAKINELTFCAGDYYSGGIDSCQGDSGAPLMCRVQGRFVIHGIVSNGIGCALPTYPGIYTRVAHPQILQFIKRAIGTK